MDYLHTPAVVERLDMMNRLFECLFTALDLLCPKVPGSSRVRLWFERTRARWQALRRAIEQGGPLPGPRRRAQPAQTETAVQTAETPPKPQLPALDPKLTWGMARAAARFGPWPRRKDGLHFGWATELMKDMIGSRHMLRTAALDPDMAVLVKALPELGCILRQMCWTLGIPRPDSLRTGTPKGYDYKGRAYFGRQFYNEANPPDPEWTDMRKEFAAGTHHSPYELIVPDRCPYKWS